MKIILWTLTWKKMAGIEMVKLAVKDTPLMLMETIDFWEKMGYTDPTEMEGWGLGSFLEQT